MVPNGLLTPYWYVIPPLLGFIVFLAIALVSFRRARQKQTNILFSGICLIGAVFNADAVVIPNLTDEILALRIDRMVHFFFVFSIPLYIRFVHSFL
jgi:uncharacterized membrane protein